MQNQADGTSSSGLRATLIRAWSAGRTVARESTKPKAVPIEAYLLPRHTHHNRAEIQNGKVCGCISCEQIFPVREIRDWVGGESTAVCPRCGATAIVGAGAGFPLTRQLLNRAHQMLFEGRGRRV